nr:MAG TPA: hypothetical protein [Caudoviricetes sp.]
MQNMKNQLLFMMFLKMNWLICLQNRVPKISF